MPESLYYVQPGDTLWKIAKRFGTTVEALLGANVICNPDLIFPDQILIIPQPGLELPRAGGGPYYIVQRGDTLWCLSKQFGATIRVLADNNQLPDPNLIFAGSELLVINTRPNPAELKARWEGMGGVPCDEIPGFTIHGIYYLGSFEWEALGCAAIPYLLQLLRNPCYVVRMYAAISLGRLALDHQVKSALAATLNDPAVAPYARLALRRIELAAAGQRRVHLVTTDTRLYAQPNLGSPVTPMPAGTEVTGTRWFVPSPTGEEGPRGGLQIYDQVRVVRTGKVGFLPRLGLDELTLV